MKYAAWKNVRDIVLFLSGLAGVYHEVVMTTTERPTLLLLFAAMMGLPAFLRTDERPSRKAEGIDLMRQGIEDQRSKLGGDK